MGCFRGVVLLDVGSMTARNLKSLSPEEMASFLHIHAGTPVQSQNVYRSLYRDHVSDISELQLGAKVRAKLEKEAYIPSLRPTGVMDSEDGSKKLVFRVPEGTFEAVSIPIKDRITVCISSQVGCVLDCSFCITGTLGFKRNLLAWEMVEQILCAQKEAGKKVSNVVFMGMGEPFYNVAEVKKCVQIITSHHGLGIGKSKITVSTSGVIPEMVRWGKEVGTNLAVSVIAATEEKRSRLMNINKKYPLKDLIAAIREYTEVTGKKVFCEYVLMNGLTDEVSDVDALVALFVGMNVTINLIPYNDNPTLPYKRPDREATLDFRHRLTQRGLFCTIRWSYGGDIGAACGQLA